MSNVFGEGASGGDNSRGSGRLCQVCGKEAAGYYFGILTCSSCQKFRQRHSTCEVADLECKVGRPLKYTLCNLSGNRPCSKCRLEKMKILSGEMRRNSSTDNEASSSSSSASHSSQRYREALDEVGKLQTRIVISCRIRGVPITFERVLFEPSNFDLQTTQDTLRNIMTANREFAEAEYRYTYEFLMANGGIPSEDGKFWELIGMSVEDIVKGNIPFARHLAGYKIESPSDMCHLIDTSYWLMYCVQSGIIAKTDVVSAFGLLFRNMLVQWPELEAMMDCAQQIVHALRVWSPKATEFAFLMSLIFCHSTCNNRAVSPQTVTVLQELAVSVEMVGKIHVCELFGSQIGELRWRQLKIILDTVTTEKDIRSSILRPFKQRRPELLRTIVHPVCSVVCREFSSNWNLFTNPDTPRWPPPYSHGNPNPCINEMTDCLLAAI